ncbi:hypothetical protein H9P43_006309 [Blastocladiella emersonii ATCC 22665]|nr:hypothetical protein H9P43_006309 [Blastocladiella emersonii ATCC 22665]
MFSREEFTFFNLATPSLPVALRESAYLLDVLVRCTEELCGPDASVFSDLPAEIFAHAQLYGFPVHVDESSRDSYLYRVEGTVDRDTVPSAATATIVLEITLDAVTHQFRSLIVEPSGNGTTQQLRIATFVPLYIVEASANDFDLCFHLKQGSYTANEPVVLTSVSLIKVPIYSFSAMTAGIAKFTASTRLAVFTSDVTAPSASLKLPVVHAVEMADELEKLATAGVRDSVTEDDVAAATAAAAALQGTRKATSMQQAQYLRVFMIRLFEACERGMFVVELLMTGLDDLIMVPVHNAKPHLRLSSVQPLYPGHGHQYRVTIPAPIVHVVPEADVSSDASKNEAGGEVADRIVELD